MTEAKLLSVGLGCADLEYLCAQLEAQTALWPHLQARRRSVHQCAACGSAWDTPALPCGCYVPLCGMQQPAFNAEHGAAGAEPGATSSSRAPGAVAACGIWTVV